MPTVTFAHTGTSMEMEAGASFLDACQSSDAPADFGCQSGNCGVCTVLVEAGAENLSPASEDEMEMAGSMTSDSRARLGCQILVNGNVTLRPFE